MGETATGQVPEFITFLFSSKPKFDCYFIVGNKNIGEPERIGGVKLMLMAHSDVFRCELEDSEIAEKEDVKVEDTDPETFKSMLKYVYGHDTTDELSFDEADNLLYLSEKYMMKRLKNRVATRLTCLLTPDNICSLLNNPACFTHLELDCEITKILQYDTDKVFASTQFLGLSPEGFLKIVEQEGLAVPEIEVWRAAVKWAKQRAGNEDSVVLRKHISVVEKHIRVCTLNIHEFCQKVAPSDTLSSEEVALVCQSIIKKEKQGSLITFSNEVETRKILRKTENIEKELVLSHKYKVKVESNNPTCCLEVVTYNCPIMLKKFRGQGKERRITEPEGWTYKVECKVTIMKVANPHIQDGSSEPDHDNLPMVIRSTQQVKLGCYFHVNFTNDGNPVTLLPYSKYSIIMEFTGRIMNFKINPESMILEHEDWLLAHTGSLSTVLNIWYDVVKPILNSYSI